MKTVGAFEAKTYLSRILAEVEEKKEQYIIKKRGQKIALLIPYDDKSQKTPEAALEIIQQIAEIRKSIKPKLYRKEIRELISAGRR